MVILHRRLNGRSVCSNIKENIFDIVHYTMPQLTNSIKQICMLLWITRQCSMVKKIVVTKFTA